jgi:DNA polymerase III subunit alpha
MASTFTHLHVHSHYSLLNALPKIDDLVKLAKKYEMKALALTDNCNLYGTIEFIKACKKAEIKPIIGTDAYVAARTRHDKQAGVDNRRTRLVLLAKNIDGYRNLIQLVTKAHLEGFYYKPRIDAELIEAHAGGLVCISPSFSGAISQALKNRDEAKARELVEWYKKIYGPENFFLEVTHHPEIEGHEDLMQKIKALAKDTGTELVAAHDVYYLHPEDRLARHTLMMVQSSGEFLENDEGDFSFISQAQAEEFFKDVPEAVTNTAKIADMCNLNLELGKWVFPNYIVESGLSYDDELKRLAYDGIERRGLQRTPEVMTRLDYELKVIRDKGYAQYFLVVSDLLRYAHENGILTNIRGSVAGSLATYVTGITNVDPLEYRLPFERFLNPERPSAPDIDMDFADNRRDEVIDYARKKYGYDKLAQIGTFGTMMARGAVRDVARAMGYPYTVGDRISKLIPMGAQGFPMTIDRALDEVAELREMYEKEEDTKKILDMAKKIEGCARHMGVHAAGVVIAPRPLIEYVPLQYDPKGEGKIITQYDMHAVGEDGIGLLKFDFLGIKNLSILADAIDRVKKIDGIDVDIEKIPLDDKKTFDLLARGDTIGLFQLNGSGMTRFLVELKPSSIHDINAMVALYRPGPLESIPQYIERKHDHSKIEYLDPRLKNIVERSFGVITYQDDVMMIAIELAGYSWLEADKLRKAMGKKIPKEMEEQKGKLIDGLVKNGMAKIKAEKLWKLIEPFAAYGFNKCVSGHTIIVDANTGERITVRELYESKRKMRIHSMDDSLKITGAEVTNVAENGIKDTYEIKTRSGRMITTTDNHPFRTIEGWKELKNIHTGEKVAVARVTETRTESQVYWDEVVSIEHKGVEMTYDLTVPPYHNFVANDFIVHNSHAASYGRVAYQTAYMKANFPEIYMSAVLTADSGDVEKIGEFINECKRMGIPVLPPDINESFSAFTVVKTPDDKGGFISKIRFGLTTIKNFGEGIGKTIIHERKANGKYTSLANFLERVKDKNLNKKSMEALIKSGAMDTLGERGQMLANLEDLLKYNKDKSQEASSQDSLFAGIGFSHISNLTLREAAPATQPEKLAWEKELLGLYISGHPLDKYKAVLDTREMNIKKAKETLKDGQFTVIAGIIEEAKNIVTKKGDNMMFLKITDYTDSIEMVAFPRTYMEFKNLLQPERCIAVKGKMSDRNGTQSIVIDRVKGL